MLIASCSSIRQEVSDDVSHIYPSPKTVDLNSSGGYIINALTGDTIQPVINSSGDTISSGVPVPVTGKVIPANSVGQPFTFPAGKPEVIPLKSNAHQIPESLVSITVNRDSLRTFTPGVDTLLSFVEIPSRGRLVPLKQPVPVKALPPRFRDNAVYHIKYLDVVQGMKSSTIYSLMEDSRGNLWFGTEAGVSRYNGESFTHFTVNEGLSDYRVFTMLEDSEGNLWFGTYGGGVTMYDGETFTYITEKEGLSNNAVMDILEDRNGNLWIGTLWGGVTMFNGSSFTYFTEKEGLSENQVSSILEDREGNLWFGTYGGGVSMFDGETFTCFTEKEGMLSNRINSILEDNQGRLWFSSWNGVSMYNGETFTHFTAAEGLSNPNVGPMLVDKHGNLWFGTWGGGVNMFNGKTITHYTEAEGLSNNFVQSILEDSRGNLWFGTRDGGVNIFKRETFAQLTDQEGLSSHRVLSVNEDHHGNQWFGTSGGGIYRYDGETFAHFTYKEGLYSDVVVSILKDRHGNLWFGKDGTGATRYDGESFTHFTEAEGLSNNHIWTMLEDQHHNLWFGTFLGGVSMYNGKNFTHFTEKEGLGSNSVWSILEDRHGHLWFGTMGGGVTMYDGRSFTHFTEKEGLSNNNVWSILEDRRGNLWFGTDGGVNIFNGKSFRYVTEKEGLSSNYISTILEDGDGNIWISTQNGLNRLSFETVGEIYTDFVIHNFGLQDGLKGINFSKYSAFLDSKNRIWWGTDKSLTMLDLDDFQISDSPPAAQLNGIDINESFVDYRLLRNGDGSSLKFEELPRFQNYPVNLELPYKLNHLTFHFSAIDWSAPHKIRYSFKMEGLDDKWSIPGAEPIADYRNLPNGKYTFRIRAMGEAQRWSEPFAYSFTVLPPFWLRWWAYLMYGLVFIFIVLWTRRFERNREKLKADLRVERIQKEKVQELERMKTRFFTNVSHEFRTPLTLILGPLEDILRKGQTGEDPNRGIMEMMTRNAKRLQRLINQLLDISRLESGSMIIEESKGDLTGFVRTLASAFLSLAESKKISYLIQLPEEKSTWIFDHDKLEKIVTNLLSNAFKYTSREGTVKLVLEYRDPKEGRDSHFAILTVQDTGRGIKENQLAKIFDRFSISDHAENHVDDSVGIGLALTKELVELLQGTIEVKSEPGVGTEFTVTLPVSNGSNTSLPGGEPTYNIEEQGTEFDQLQQIQVFEKAISGAKVLNPFEILVVEDNEDLRGYICSILEPEYAVFDSVNGKDGWDFIQDRIPDLVISDLIMPEMGGLELCGELKNDFRTCHIPIIILTAKSDLPSKLEGLATGADDYISKPFDADELRIRVKNLVTQREKLKEIYRRRFLDQEQQPAVKSASDELITRLLETFEKNYSDFDFSVDDMGNEMLMSRAQFYRKVNALTGSSPNELLRLFRIRKAATLLESGNLNITSVMYEVGFRSTSHFAESFRKYFGKNPSEYRESLLNGK